MPKPHQAGFAGTWQQKPALFFLRSREPWVIRKREEGSRDAIAEARRLVARGVGRKREAQRETAHEALERACNAFRRVKARKGRPSAHA